MIRALWRALLALACVASWLALVAPAPAGAVVLPPIAPWATTSALSDFLVVSGDGNAVAVAPGTVRDVPSGVERSVAGGILALDRTGRRALAVDMNPAAAVWRVHDLVAGTSRTVDTTQLSAGTSAIVEFGGAALSADGTVVVFSTFNGGTLETGLWVTVGDRAPVSMTAGRDLGVMNRRGSNPVISADGRYVVFEWQASAGFCSRPEPQCTVAVIRYDVLTGASQVVSVGPGGVDAPGRDLRPAISGDGRYVAWMSDSIALVPGTTVRRQRLYVRDMAAGVTRLAHTGLTSEGTYNRVVSMSDDGRRIAVTAIGTIVNGAGVSAAQIVNVVDLDDGTIRPVQPGEFVLANAGSRSPTMTAAGDAVVFFSNATNLAPGSGANVFRAALAPPTVRPAEPVFIAFGPEPTAPRGRPIPLRRITSYVGGSVERISGDGRYLGSNDGNSIPSSVQRYDTTNDTATKVAFVGRGLMSTDGRFVGQLGCRRTIDGGAVVVAPGALGCSETPAPISGDGSVLFQAPSTVWTVGGGTRTIDATAGGTRPLIGGGASLSDDGAILLTARLLPTPCTVCTEFVAVDLTSGVTTLLPDGAVSADGRWLIFASEAAGVVPGVSTPGPRLYRRDLRSGATVLVHDGATGGGTVANTGRVAFLSYGAMTEMGAYVVAFRATVWDERHGRHYMDWAADGSAPDASVNGGSSVPRISGDGNTLAFLTHATNLFGPLTYLGALVVADVSTLPIAAPEPAPAPAPAPAPGSTSGSGSGSTSVVPERLLDTRTGVGRGGDTAKPGPASTVELQVTGAGVTAVPADASAVVLNVTATEATADGYVTVWPCGAPRPVASNLNVAAGRTVPNLVTVKPGDGGRICLFTQSGTHLLADLAAWYPAGAALTPVVPERLLDTRTGAGRGGDTTKPEVGATVELQVTGAGASAVPANASAVLLNVTGTEASADGYVTVWPCGAPRPTASSLNLVAGGTRPNLVAVKLGDGGRVCLFTQSGTHLVADLAAWFPANAALTPIVPERVLDTRTGLGRAGSTAKPVPGETVRIAVGIGLATPVPADARTLVLNITATEATADGYVTVWSCDAPRPTASNLNLVAGETAANLVTVGPGTSVCLYTQSGAHLVADLAGFEA